MGLRRSPSSRPWQRPLLIVGGLLLIVVALGLLALPFRHAPAAAQSAKADLEAAQGALSAGDIEEAEASIRSARGHTDEVQDAVQGIGGDVWSWVPLASGPVRDVRSLGDALDSLTSVAEVAVETLPQVQGPDATLFGDGSVDLATLESVTRTVADASDHLYSAERSLGDVDDSALGVGTQLADARDEAAAVVNPLASAARRAEPLIDALEPMLGGDGTRDYLLALLNPSEQRFSGGAPLTFVPMEVTDGTLTMGTAQDATDPNLYRVGRWPKVEGNPFHNGKLRLSTATFAPDWSVSGEELLRGWERRTGQETDGLIAVDVVALSDMLRVTGPVEAPLYGQLDSSNFTKALIGDYDAYPDPYARRELNRAIVPLFAERLLAPGKGLEKIESLRKSAAGRHVAMWMRDPEVQAALADVGLTGELSDTEHDYLAVFNQNTSVSKADYWQRRTLDSRVRLREDGSAKVRLTVSVHNDSPPYTQYYPDPRGGSYVTRWNGMTLGAFLPSGARISRATADGREQGTKTFDYYGRPYKLLRLVIPPTETRTAVLEYTVPNAAEVADGSLAYALDITPQGMVIPQRVRVSVTWPRGYSVDEVPDGWTADGRKATYATDALDSQPSFSVTGSTAEDTEDAAP